MREPFRKARLYITILLVIEIIVGIVIIIVTGLYHFILGSFLADTERKMLNGQFFNTYLLGLQLIVVYASSICLWTRLWIRCCTPNVVLIIKVWLCFCFLIVMCGFGTVWSLFMCASAIETTAEMSLFKGIDLYYTCPEWKLLWDGLQFHRECCGVYSYKDWMNAAWMPSDALEPIDEEQDPKCDITTLAPYACCKHTCHACFENYVPRTGNSGIPYLNLTQINVNGCLEHFSHTMWNILYILLFLVLIAFKIDLIICGLSRNILRKQDMSGSGGGDYNYCMTDESGQPMVFKNVEEENCSACIPNSTEDMLDPCSCNSELKRGYAIRQLTEVIPAGPSEKPTQQQNCEKPQSSKKRANNKPRFVH